MAGRCVLVIKLYTFPSTRVLGGPSRISRVALGALVGRVVVGDPRSKPDGGWLATLSSSSSYYWLPTLPGNRPPHGHQPSFR